MKSLFLFSAAALVSAAAQAAPTRDPPLPPLPPPRPKFEAALQKPTPAPDTPAREAGACAPVQQGRLIGVSLPPVTGDGGCGIASPVRISGVQLRNGSKLKLTPDAVLECNMAAELADFLDEETARIEQAGDGKVVEVQHAGAYECRGQNRVTGAKLSEHANGNAIDLRAFKFADGHALVIGSDKAQAWTGLKNAACGRFKTVLGPGSDAEHKDHLHLDMRARKSMTICQWVLD